MASQVRPQPAWWQGTTIYQIYPRSFMDSDSDGIGDLPGIIAKLDHVADLGVETVWVSPFFCSPQEDFGYDVTDYTGVAEEYGTISDAERLIDECHDRGLKIMFDLVLNHTSDQHPWFLRSRGSRNNPKADWYIWADGRGKGGKKPPNNWKSAMEINSAWQWSPQRRQWYMATFLPFQPDLNWRNPDVKEAMFAAVRFWLDRGVDGFRLDIFGQIMKDPMLRDNPLRPHIATGFPRGWQRLYTENTPDNITLAQELHDVCAEYGDSDRILLGEVFGPADVLREYHAGGAGLDLVFLFDFLTYTYDAEWFRGIIGQFEESFPHPMQPTYVLENHDRSRLIDRVGGDVDKAKVLATILLTTRGVPTIYMGQEIGMSNTSIPLKDALDPIASKFFSWIPETVNKRLTERLNRDECRTPMQWDGSPNAGFTGPDVVPWLPVNDNHTEVNVVSESAADDSVLATYRTLLSLRRSRAALRNGSLELIDDLPAGILGYRRRDPVTDEQIVILANFGDGATRVQTGGGSVLFATRSAAPDGGSITLPRDCAVVLEPPVS